MNKIEFVLLVGMAILTIISVVIIFSKEIKEYK